MTKPNPADADLFDSLALHYAITDGARAEVFRSEAARVREELRAYEAVLENVRKMWVGTNWFHVDAPEVVRRVREIVEGDETDRGQRCFYAYFDDCSGAVSTKWLYNKWLPAQDPVSPDARIEARAADQVKRIRTDTLALLRRLEWSGEHGRCFGTCLECKVCPSCARDVRLVKTALSPQAFLDERRRPLEPRDKTHREDCALAKAIAELEKMT